MSCRIYDIKEQDAKRTPGRVPVIVRVFVLFPIPVPNHFINYSTTAHRIIKHIHMTPIASKMGVFKRRKQKSSDSQGSCSSGNSSGSNSSLEKKQQTPQSNPLKSSLHSSEGGSTSGYKTCQSGSYGTCRSRQSAQKNVRFSQVHVREYERSLGDNPSCSSGAPIG